MNLFCFSLEGSMDSLYEAVQDSSDAQVYTIPCRSSSRSCSPSVLLDENPKSRGSGRSISMEISQMQNNNTKKKKRRTHVSKSASENGTLDHTAAGCNTALWLPAKVSPEDDLDFFHIKNNQNEELVKPMLRTEVQAKATIRTDVKTKGGRGVCKSRIKKNEKPPTPPIPPTQMVSYEGWAQNPDRPNSRQRDLIVHANREVAKPRVPIKRSPKPGNQKTGSQKTWKKGSAKNGKEGAKKNQDTTRNKELRKSPTDNDTYGPIPVIAGPYLDVVRRSAPGCESVLPSAQENATLAPGATELRTGPGGPGAHPRNQRWSNPAENAQAWGTSYHICRRPLTEYPVYAHDYTLPRAKDWDKHQGLAQYGSLKRDPSPQGVPISVTDGDLCNPNRSTSFGRFDGIRQPSPARLEENVTSVAEESGCEGSDQTKQGSLGKKMKAISLTMRRKMGKKHSKTFSAEAGEDTDRDLEEEKERGHPLEKGPEKTRNSLESLYSGQSSSSSGGVASVSDGSSTRDSLRLEEDGSYNGHFCGRARVHTDFVPSPYDTDSIKLKVGDIISIISKPPMGIWTGMLNNKVGNFKFIYVDVVMEKEREEEAPKIRPQRMSKRPRPKTLLELLERLHLEEYASALLLNGYQTVEDLRHLQEKHLIELNVMNPEHRGRLLAAVNCRYTESDDVRESEEPSSSHSLKEEKSDCPRDSGCFILSECSENIKEDTESQPVTH
ncbi:uncharacterized protein LOC121567729 isoform X2 [Coregonus clupeaformis]|uniref:uncharacterized protein LOC121567729 isoform X2 n=1 Tax=Coregonus clupeaformis TaxID=59861 RepID=UPI001BE094FF|nr:uncharacterized protein LOC121567729 isoform X2 [Coregonus clupeaformis]